MSQVFQVHNIVRGNTTEHRRQVHHRVPHCHLGNNGRDNGGTMAECDKGL